MKRYTAVAVSILFTAALALPHNVPRSIKKNPYLNGPTSGCPIAVYLITTHDDYNPHITLIRFENISGKDIKAFDGKTFVTDVWGDSKDVPEKVEWVNREDIQKPLKPGKKSAIGIYNFYYYGMTGMRGFRLTRLLYNDGTKWLPDNPNKCVWSQKDIRLDRRR